MLKNSLIKKKIKLSFNLIFKFLLYIFLKLININDWDWGLGIRPIPQSSIPIQRIFIFKYYQFIPHYID